MGELVALLGCSQSSLPMTYLGLPFGAKFKGRAIWNLFKKKWSKISELEAIIFIKGR